MADLREALVGFRDQIAEMKGNLAVGDQGWLDWTRRSIDDLLAAHPPDEMAKRLAEAEKVIGLAIEELRGQIIGSATSQAALKYRVRHCDHEWESNTFGTDRCTKCGVFSSPDDPDPSEAEPTGQVSEAELRGRFLDEINLGKQNDFHVAAQWVLIFDRFADYIEARAAARK